MSFVEEALQELNELIVESENSDSLFVRDEVLDVHRFIGYFNSLISSLVLGAGLEGLKVRSARVTFSFNELPEARAVLEFDGVVFIVYGKPYIDVTDVDYAADYASDVCEEFKEDDLVVVISGFEFSYYAEKYARTLGMEVVRLGL